MNADTMLKDLKLYLLREALDGSDQDLAPNTPLLEWGIVDSVTMTGLISFIEQRYGITVPDDEIVPEHFETLDKLVSFVLSLPTPTHGGPQLA